MLQLQESIANDLEIQTWPTLAEAFQHRPDPFQTPQGAGRADPDQLHATARPHMLRQRIPVRIETGADDVNAIGRGPQGGMIAQEVVAGDHGVAVPDHSSKTAGAR